MPTRDEPTYSGPGLLEGIADTALDDDYYEIRSNSSKGNATLMTGIGLALFALLVTIAMVQNRNDRPANRVEVDTLISNIQSRKASVHKGNAQAAKLRTQVEKLNKASSRIDPKVETLRLIASDSGAFGPGIVVTANDSAAARANGRVTDLDLQRLVNGLWYAGAEAVSINGNRLSSLSSIRSAGASIKVNYRPIGTPYVITALGDSSGLADRLADNPGGRYWARRVAKAGLRFEVNQESDLMVQATPAQRVTILHAHGIKGGS